MSDISHPKDEELKFNEKIFQDKLIQIIKMLFTKLIFFFKMMQLSLKVNLTESLEICLKYVKFERQTRHSKCC